jgi:hypothetical protein
MRLIKVKYGKVCDYDDMAGFVYIGRCFGGFAASPLANRWRRGVDGSLDQVLNMRWDYVMISSTIRRFVLPCWR